MPLLMMKEAQLLEQKALAELQACKAVEIQIQIQMQRLLWAGRHSCRSKRVTLAALFGRDERSFVSLEAIDGKTYRQCSMCAFPAAFDKFWQGLGRTAPETTLLQSKFRDGFVWNSTHKGELHHKDEYAD